MSRAAAPAVLPTLSLQETATDNANLAVAGQQRSDLISDLDAGLVLREHGPRFAATGEAGVEFIDYARHTAPAMALPRGRIDLASTLVERALFLDGGVSATRAPNNPFAPFVDSTSTSNMTSTVSVHASPYLAHDFSPTVSALLRSDTVVSRSRTSGGVAPAGSTVQSQTFRLTRKPVPLGVYVEADHELTRYTGAAQPALTTYSAVAGVADAVGGDVLLGTFAGREHSRYNGVASDDTRGGVTFGWQPERRTSVDATIEHRFFGTAWNLHARERMPLWIADITLQRTATASTSALSAIDAASDPRALLDDLLASRVPLAADRDAVVDEIVATRALPNAFSQPLELASDLAQRSTRATANLVANGLRNTLLVSAYYAKASPLPGAPASATPSFNSRQWGASVGLFHRLSPQLSGGAEIRWSRIDGLDNNAGNASRQLTGTLSLTRRLLHGGALTGGLRHDAATAEQTATGLAHVHRNEVFVALRLAY